MQLEVPDNEKVFIMDVAKKLKASYKETENKTNKRKTQK